MPQPTGTRVRDLSMDFFRVVSIVLVVQGHWLAAALTYHDGVFGRENPLVDIPWTQWLTWVFQVVPVFFLIAGYAGAVSWTHWQQGGNGPRQLWLRRRLARVLGPTAVYVALVSAVVLTLAAVGVGDSVLMFGGWAVALHLWFLGVYLLVSSLTPVLVAAHQRWGLALPAALAAGVAVVDVLRIGFGVPAIGWVNYVFCWAAVYQLGIAWHGGLLAGRRPAVLAVLGAGTLAVLLRWGPYPISMIGLPGDGVQNTSPPSLLMLAFSGTQAGLVLLVAPALNRWLSASRIRRALAIANDNVMALYLWHMVPVVIVTVIAYPAGLLPQPPLGSGAWWLARLEWLALLSVVTAAELVLLWWCRAFFAAPLPVVHLPLPARLGEWTMLAGAAAAAFALSRLAAGGFAPHGRFAGMVVALFALGTALAAAAPRTVDFVSDTRTG